MDKMREEFDSWYSEYKLQHDPLMIGKHVAWQSWQASRAALVVDMTVHEEFDKRMFASNVYKELDKAGIKYE